MIPYLLIRLAIWRARVVRQARRLALLAEPPKGTVALFEDVTRELQPVQTHLLTREEIVDIRRAKWFTNLRRCGKVFLTR